MSAKGRAYARAMWLEIAGGQFSREAMLWVSNVASDVLRADDEPDDKRRHARLASAIGLFGVDDTEAINIRNVVSSADFFCDLIESGSKYSGPGRPLKRGERAKCRREAVVRALGWVDASDEAVDKKIRRALGLVRK